MASSSSISTSRLVDYISVIGFDDSKERNGISFGKVLQRFPVKDWPDVKFISSLDLFCQPQGWSVRSTRLPPSFFVCVLTDEEAGRHYAACLCFDEPRFPSESPVLLEDDMDEMVSSAIASPSGKTPVLYCPKCLVLVSRHPFFEAFKNCLGTLYTVYIEKMSVELESLVGNLLSSVRVPPAGGPLLKFTLGAGDRQAVQPPLSPTIPASQTTVALLFQQLGIYNVICLFCGILTDRKILFHSQSYSRLTDACHALSCLIYPLKYSYVYVPILPGNLLDVLHSPTPYVMGVHSSFRPQTAELVGSSVFDVISVDLDSGSVFIPEHITVSPIPEPYHGRLSTWLTLVLNKELYSADLAFSSGNGSPKNSGGNGLGLLDKQIRACFVRLFAELLADYRLCLKILRLYPSPCIAFHKAAFMGLRGFQDDEFMNRLLDSMSFQAFTAERGLPFRVCDLFDETVASVRQNLTKEKGNLALMSENINALAQQLLLNESPSCQPFVTKVPKPSEASLMNPAPPAFPELDPEKVQLVIDSMQEKVEQEKNVYSGSPVAREVPTPSLDSERSSHAGILSGPNVRRLDVLKNCLRCIFDNKISDARKMLSAVLLSMKSQAVRVAFCQELQSNYNTQNRATLEAQQFDLIVRLMNSALQNESAADEHGVAYALLTLSAIYCRRLSPGVHQFAYTCIQDHSVWANPQFWESAFVHDVNLQLRQYYLPASSQSTRKAPFGRGAIADTWNLYDEPSTLQVACDKLKDGSRTSNESLKKMETEEQDIIYSQAMQYTTHMVNLRIPMDASRLRRVNVQDLEQRSVVGSQLAESVMDDSMSDTSDSTSDVESGYVEGDVSRLPPGLPNDLGHGTVRWIAKFLDKVCSDANLDDSRMKQLHQRIPGFVGLHIENLEQVYRESKRLPPISKPRMSVPWLDLPGEKMLQGYLRVFLLPDGRADMAKTVEKTHGSSLLPAEGAIFLTNYRIIFKGQPCDPYVCEQVVIRWMPVMSVTKDKRIGQQFLAAAGTEQCAHHLHDALQIRSATFQLLKVAFDEEVSPDKVESFCTALEQLRWPEKANELFAISGGALSASLPASVTTKNKPKTLTQILVKKARKAGLATGLTDSSRQKGNKYVLGTEQNRSLTLKPKSAHKRESGEEDHESIRNVVGEATTNGSLAAKSTFGKTLERLTERDYCKDYQRLDLCTKVELTLHSGSTGTKPSPLHQKSGSGFRLATLNRMYTLCGSYPAVIVVPNKITDENLKKITKGHKHGRFPVVTWCSPNGALLLRGSRFHEKNVVSRLKKHTKDTLGGAAGGPGRNSIIVPTKQGFSSALVAGSLGGGQAQSAMSVLKSSSLEQERYISCILSLSPTQPNLGHSSHLTSSMGSLLSLDSLMLTSFETGSNTSSTSTPEPYRRAGGNVSSVSSFTNMMRGSGGKTSKTFLSTNKFGSLRPAYQHKQKPSSSAFTLMTPSQKKRGSDSSLRNSKDYNSAPQTLTRASLYIFGEKGQAKSLKLEQKCEFIPVDYPSSHEAKACLKKFLRVTAPSSLAAENTYSHLKALEESGWLQMVKSLLQVSNAIVDLVDIQNSSVALCLEDGWDATTQLSCLAQILLDPYYRTMEGIRILIEKEWLAFGHRFSHRCNHTLDSASSGFAPIFILFLDAVHQVCQQFPAAFEYNDFFLRFLAYHSSAGYFGTFLLDSEAERVEAGLIHFENKPRPRPELMVSSPEEDSGHPVVTSGSLGKMAALASGGSIWDYVEERHRKSAMFQNFLYSPGVYGVLRPQFSIPSLDVWEFYCQDYLAYGSAYDLDAAEAELLQRQSEGRNLQDVGGVQSERRVIDLSYDSVAYSQPSVFQSLLEEICTLERDLDLLPHQWSSIMNQVNGRFLGVKETSSPNMDREWAKWLNRALHKKSTIEILLKGKSASQSMYQWSSNRDPAGASAQHHFVKKNFAAPALCNVCNAHIFMKHALRCDVCDYCCHEKCAPVATGNCSFTADAKANESVASANPPATKSGSNEDLMTDVLDEEGSGGSLGSIPMYNETKTHEGYLMKKGALLKAWKQRWFVLDSLKHQLRYYDYDTDCHCKGYVDLKDVTTVSFVTLPAGMAKKNEGCFFDVRTIKRIYSFMANSASEAKEWVDKLQSCL